MTSYQSVWEDDETNRKVELLVNYTLEETGVTINDITPIKVTFQDRSIRVWTDKGRALLVRQFIAAGRRKIAPAAAPSLPAIERCLVIRSTSLGSSSSRVSLMTRTDRNRVRCCSQT